MEEQIRPKDKVVGSIPARGTKLNLKKSPFWGLLISYKFIFLDMTKSYRYF